MRPADARLIRITLATVWLTTGALSLGVFPVQESLSLLERVGLHGGLARAVLYLTALMDIGFGALTLFKPSKKLWLAQAMTILGYTLIISHWLPEFWLHPFGPILKNLPILLLLWLLYKNEASQTCRLT